MDVRREERKKERMERCQELGIESMDRPFFILDEIGVRCGGPRTMGYTSFENEEKVQG